MEGEAQIDLRLIFQDDKCVSFGSAMLKSRSSDSFTSQLKDFVAPVGINLQNCGNVIIRKQTYPNGQACFDGLLFGSYNVTETVPADQHHRIGRLAGGWRHRIDIYLCRWKWRNHSDRQYRCERQWLADGQRSPAWHLHLHNGD